MEGFPEFETLDLEAERGWLTVWLNSPENRNALTPERARDLTALCSMLATSAGIRGVVFRGRGGVFCAGGDLKSFGRMMADEADRDKLHALSLDGAALFDAIHALPQFTIMAVEGAAMAGGLGMVCLGDHVIATGETKFALSEVRIGLTPAQIAPFVIQRLGMRVGRSLMLTGARFDGIEAQKIGLVDAVVDDADALTAAIEQQKKVMAGAAPGAVAAIKAQIAQLPFQTRDGQKQAAADSFAGRMLSNEAREGIRAFAEKRKPSWTVE
ncbi:MAG: enoyl-CoA hydratase/isomerase family protein [Rhizobiaceae bacterium]|nr:enoyl-CoA hydratase/isomerase family protein [Rhizobiaceae bacterium]